MTIENESTEPDAAAELEASAVDGLVMPEWCPTQSGTHTAYVPEYYHNDRWVAVPTEAGGKCGIPQPYFNQGVNSTLGLFGYEQAMALAYSFAAHSQASGMPMEVRVQKYEVQYKLKARKIEA